jgi:hypothetical protein
MKIIINLFFSSGRKFHNSFTLRKIKDFSYRGTITKKIKFFLPYLEKLSGIFSFTLGEAKNDCTERKDSAKLRQNISKLNDKSIVKEKTP